RAALEKLKVMQERADAAEADLDRANNEIEKERSEREYETRAHAEELQQAREAEGKARTELERLAATQSTAAELEAAKQETEALSQRVEQWETWYRDNYEQSLGVVQAKVDRLKATWDESLRGFRGGSFVELEQFVEESQRSRKLLLGGKSSQRFPGTDTSSSTLEDFKKQLVLRHGSLTNAWRQSLDVEGEGRIPFMTFCRTAREIGFARSVKQLWRQLDVRQTGFITLASLDEAAGHHLQSFREALVKKYGGISEGWDALDPAVTGLIAVADFASRCREVLELSNGKEVATILDLERGGIVTLEDIDRSAFERWVRSAAVGEASGSVSFKLLQRLARHHRLDSETLEPEAFSPSRGSIKFLAQLRRDYGTLGRAWSLVMDSSSRGSITFLEFARVCRAMGYEGGVKPLWLRLGGGTGPLLLDHIDPDAAALIADFKGALRRTAGSLAAGWRRCIDPKGGGRVSWRGWCEALHSRGRSQLPARFNDVEIRELFELFDPDRCGFVTLEDVDRREFQDAIPSASTSSSAPTKESYAKTVEILSTLPSPQATGDDLELYPVEQFKQALERSFGSVLRAWIRCFDEHGTTRISFPSFCGVATAFGFPGRLKQLWLHLGELPEGGITLQSVDPQAYDLIMRFRQGVEAKHRSLAEAWITSLHSDPHGRVDPDVFISQCERRELLDGFTKADAQMLLHELCIGDTESLSIVELDSQALGPFKDLRKKLLNSHV
ncbi:hypothetical protein FOZ62_025001, partial [Perkinsus olseni]